MPSFALRMATFMPRTCVFMRSAMARPAASSLELFTRRPEDKRAMVVAKEMEFCAVLRCALSDITLVLMVIAMMAPQKTKVMD